MYTGESESLTSPFFATPTPPTLTTPEVPSGEVIQTKQIQTQKWYQNRTVKWVSLGILILGLILLFLFLLHRFLPQHPTTSTLQSGGGITETGMRPALTPPPSPPHETGISAPPSASRPTLYGNLTGNMIHDTQVIFPIGSVVTFYSPYSKGYLRMVNDTEAKTSGSIDTISSGGAVIQADGKDPSNPESHWVVKSPFQYKRAVRFDNAAYDALYLGEAQTPDGKEVVVLPGVGTEWTDFLATTINFLEPKYASDTKHVILLGIEVALLNDVEHVGANTRFFVATDSNGILTEPSKVQLGPATQWEVQVVGTVDTEGNIIYKNT